MGVCFTIGHFIQSAVFSVFHSNAKHSHLLEKSRLILPVLLLFLPITYEHIFILKIHITGWVRWFMPVILALWEVEVDASLEVSSLRPAWPTWLNPIFTKN